MSVVLCVRCELRQYPCGGPCACTVDGRDIRKHEAADYCPHPDGPRFGTAHYPLGWPSRGLGDSVAKAIRTATFGLVEHCGGCEERAAKLNAAVPYKT